MSGDRYREAAAVVETLREWDVILLHGGVRLIGLSARHLPYCQIATSPESCRCFSQPPISSPVVDRWKRPLVESAYDSKPLTGEARHLLWLADGDEVEAHSGKMYRLEGPRKHAGYDALSAASIFRVYAEEDARKVAMSRRLKVDAVVVVVGLVGSVLLSVLKLLSSGFDSFVGWVDVAVPAIVVTALWVLSWCVEGFYKRKE